MKQNNVDPSGDMGAISSGSGEINDTSISIGDHSIFIKNISALSVEKLPIDWNLYLLSLFIFIVGSSVWEKSFFFGGVLILTGGFLGYKNFISRNDHSLRIKVNSGGMFSIVSRDKKLLIKIRDFLLEKINFPDKLSVANFNLTDNHFHTDGGGVSIGEGSIATGRNGVFNNGAGS